MNTYPFYLQYYEEAVSATTVGYDDSMSSRFSGLLSEMIRLIVGVGTLLWFHALAAVFKDVIKMNVDARSRVYQQPCPVAR